MKKVNIPKNLKKIFKTNPKAVVKWGCSYHDMALWAKKYLVTRNTKDGSIDTIEEVKNIN
tara:strand:+ start:85 stop:264 length:180 start_codon:yes stop_codon:yes gene_type:complete